MFARHIIAAALATAAFLSPAAAATLSLQDTLGTFNAVSLGLFSQQEIEGRAFVQGDILGGGGQFGFVDAGDGLDLDVLYVTGTVTNANIKIQNGNDATVAGINGVGQSIINSTFEMNGHGTLILGGTRSGGNFNQGTLVENAANIELPMIDFGVFKTQSEALAALDGEDLSFSDPNQKVFSGTPNADGLAVVDVDLADLNGGGYRIDLNGADTLIINVSGTTGTFSMNALGIDKALASQVIWNFADATDVNVNTAIFGHVVAPKARLSGFNGSTEGSVIASFINLTGGELHQHGFAGDLSFLDDVAVVPLPAGLVLLLTAMGSLGAARAMRRS